MTDATRKWLCQLRHPCPPAWRRAPLAVAALALVLLIGGPARAEPIAVRNAGFEGNTGNPESWGVIQDVQAFPNNGSHFQKVKAQGDNIVYICANHQSPNAYGGLFQTLSSTYAAGKSYTFAVGVAAADTVVEKAHTSPAPYHLYDTMEIRLYWDNGSEKIVIASKEISFAKLTTTAMTDCSVTIPEVRRGDPCEGKFIGVWMMITARVAHNPDNNAYWLVDHVRVTAASPTRGDRTGFFPRDGMNGEAFRIARSSDTPTILGVQKEIEFSKDQRRATVRFRQFANGHPR